MNPGDGRPLRFLAGVGALWVGVRLALVMNEPGSLPQAVRAIVPLPAPAVAMPRVPRAVRRPGPARFHPPADRRRHFGARIPATSVPVEVRVVAAEIQPTSVFARTSVSSAKPAEVALVEFQTGLSSATIAPPVPSAPIPRSSRLSVSAWMIARGGRGIGSALVSPQLGGAQGGVRVDYGLTRGVAVTGRIGLPVVGIGREAAIGIAWRPSGVPLRIVAEQRVALDGGRGGPGLGISTGVSSVRLPGGFAFDGYAQVGAIVRAGLERYVDASVRGARPLADVGGITLDIGAGAWGGAQRGVARLDVGPSLGARVPIEGATLRVSLDWRQRVAGNARPGSGPAVTLGTDF